MKLIEADKVEQAIKDYWKAQVDKALFLTDGNEKRINIYLEHNHELLKAIEALPSAEPDTTTRGPIPAETGKNDGDRTSGDCISRQVVAKFLSDWLSCLDENCHKQSASDLKMIIKDFKNLPSAQPERKTGRWIEMSSTNHAYKCSECGRLLVNVTDGKNNVSKHYPYCHCGAKMEGGE